MIPEISGLPRAHALLQVKRGRANVGHVVWRYHRSRERHAPFEQRGSEAATQ